MTKTSLALPVLQAIDLLEGGKPFPLPRIVPIEQRFPRPCLPNLEQAVWDCCERAGLRQRLRPGQRVAVAVGSRGISGLVQILRPFISYLKEIGVQPTIIPAMGSHGGPSDAGQQELLAAYGVAEATMGAAVLSSLAVKNLGQTTDGLTVWFSADALAFDAVLIVNRVKPHTDFHGSIESGLMKMCAVGLGKHKGASYIHSLGFGQLGENIKKAARLILAQANVLGGLAIVENAYSDVAQLEFLYNEEMEEKEAALLTQARSLMPSLPLTNMDVLLVQRIGKDISGAMFDPNITGRRKIWGVADLPTPSIAVMAALELTEATHGNAAGLGVADLCSTRLLQGMDFAATYASLITATLPQHAHVPMFFARDDEILLAAAKIARCQNPAAIIFSWIRDTAHIDRLWISENALRLLPKEGIEILGPPRALPFNEAGLLSWQEPG